jgi:NodT family efflux transporter outer membrane factor (OMF) lipoprotein
MIALAAGLAGCATIPELDRAEGVRRPDTVAAAKSLAGSPDSAWPDENWWQGWGDPQLDALIAEAERDSPDLAAAFARLRQAAAQAQEAGAARLPTLDASGSIGLEKQSFNNGFPQQFVALLPQGWEDNARLSATLGFDPDLWGRNRAAYAAATSEARAAALEAAQARLLLATTLAAAYADLARLFAARDVRAGALEVRLASARLVAAREAQGLETRGSRSQSEAQAATARADLAAAEEAIVLRRYQIAALAGAGPDRGLALSRPALPAALPAGLPDGATTELFARRPDIVAARARAEAAASRVAIARADFFPAIRLSAVAGLQAVGIGNLFESASVFGSVGPAISLPIFRGGALRARYRAAAAGFDQAVADYNRTVIEAYRQAADAAASRTAAGLRLGHARAALAAAEDAHRIARLRYEGGLSTYLDVLAVEDRMLAARLTVADLEGLARSTDIALIRALGGGFDPAKGAPQ